MNLPNPPGEYDQQDQAQTRSAIEQADARNVKAGAALDKLLFRDTADGTIKTVVVTSGAFVVS